MGEKPMSRLFRHDIPLWLVKFLNTVFMTVPFIIAWHSHYSERLFMGSFYHNGNYVVIILFAFLYFVFAKIYDAFYISVSRISELIFSQFLSLVMSDGIMYVVICLLSRKISDIIPLMICLFAQILISTVWSVASHKWYFRVFKPERTAIIYDMRQNMKELISDYDMSVKFNVVLNCSVRECLAKGLSDIENNGIEVVYLCGVRSHDRNTILKYCVAHGISAYVIPRIGDILMSGSKKMHMFHLPLLRVDGYKPTFLFLLSKRIFDIVSSGIAIILTAPVMLVTAIAIKAEDGGPVFYKQCRLTKGGRKYDVIKFRSMRVDAEKDGVARLSTGVNDNRITKVGRIVRRYRIDELPQLFCCFTGTMSIVGPRPERPEIASQYEEDIPEFALRLQAKAGLTGLAQVYGKYNSTPYDKLQMDLMYIANPSFLEDLRICFATVKILFMPESTEGVSSEQTTAAVHERLGAESKKVV